MWDKPQVLNALANLLYGLFAAAVLYSGVYLLVNSRAFPLRQIKVEGQLSHISRDQVHYISKNVMQGNFFTLDIDETRHAFEKLPWVRQVSIRRRWPGVLVVSIEEHQALARWGEASLVNTRGEVFEANSEDELPQFNGPEGSSQDVVAAYRKFSSVLGSKQLQAVKLELSPRRAWRMQLSNGMQVLVGRDDVDDRLKRFIGIYDRALAGRNTIGVVDLRYSNGVAIRLPASALPADAEAKPANKPGSKPVSKPAASKPGNGSKPGSTGQAVPNKPAKPAAQTTRPGRPVINRQQV